MDKERENIALYLGIHPILSEPRDAVRKRYFAFLSYYTALSKTKTRFSEALLTLYKEKILGEEDVVVAPSPSIAGLFKYRFVLLIDVLFINSFDDEKKAKDLFFKIRIKSNLADCYWLKMRQLFDRLYSGGNDVVFPQVEQIIDIWKQNQRFAQLPTFRVAFTANMSAGKSTLVNALVGKRINRSQNLACTAKLHYILSKPVEDGFISEDDHTLNLDADLQTLMTDDADNSSNIITVSTYYRMLTDQLGPISLLDTPGVNSALDKEHKYIAEKEMRKRRFDEMVYVINANSIGTDDEKQYMKKLSEIMPKKPIIFAVNKLDSFRSGEDDIAGTIESIWEDINKLPFKNVKVCPVSAYAGCLAKRALFDGDLDEDEEEELDTFLRLFRKEGHNLSRFYSQDTISACSKVIADEPDESRRNYIQMLCDCGILPLGRVLQDEHRRLVYERN